MFSKSVQEVLLEEVCGSDCPSLLIIPFLVSRTCQEFNISLLGTVLQKGVLEEFFKGLLDK